MHTQEKQTRRTAQKVSLALVLILSIFLCGCIRIWPSRVTELGNAAAPAVSGYQQGESTMLCVKLGLYGDKVATVRVINGLTGRIEFQRTSFMKSYLTYFLTVPGLQRGAYIANVSTEGILRASCQFNVD